MARTGPRHTQRPGTLLHPDTLSCAAFQSRLIFFLGHDGFSRHSAPMPQEVIGNTRRIIACPDRALEERRHMVTDNQNVGFGKIFTHDLCGE